MTALKVLMIGGSGTISTSVAHEAVALGHEVTLLNRGQSDKRTPPSEARVLRADIKDEQSVRDAIGDESFDVVVDWLAFTTDDVRRDHRLFAGRTGQFVFISSASAYQKPISMLPIRESTPLHNPYWQYSRDKIACEELLTQLYREEGFPVTVVRPSHTYDEATLPIEGGWTSIARMRRGAGVVVPGDGTSLWTLTHSRDFAYAFARLLGRHEALGETFHITSERPLPWNAIYTLIARAAGVDEPDLVHVPSDAIAAVDEDWGASLIGDKAHSVLFDNAKVRSLVPGWAPQIPFDVGAREMVGWFDADPSRQVVDERLDGLMDRLVETYRPRAL
ncbi:SDR family oxidoreductase [Herbiconiux sp. SYSU D00978]|uniref:SDR family oxidoreductase n=1 Tax=Herbiconiux sp. SYSU D00978 TaxID=2812562 RepID=UPI001A97A14C|nr:SDR family oxidoreductase [Herbiconiux sp. SYSU D00978]